MKAIKLKELKKIYDYDSVNKHFKVNVQLEDYRDAYSDWDFSPFNNRDLDEDLIEYLLSCSAEIPFKYEVVIEFHLLNQIVNQARENKSITGMYNFFNYQLRKVRNKRIRVLKNMLSFLVIGICLLIVGFYAHEYLTNSLIQTIVSEGFSIGGWVMLWEMFTAWMFDLKKLNQKRKHFERLSNSKLVYSYIKVQK